MRSRNAYSVYKFEPLHMSDYEEDSGVCCCLLCESRAIWIFQSGYEQSSCLIQLQCTDIRYFQCQLLLHDTKIIIECLEHLHCPSFLKPSSDPEIAVFQARPLVRRKAPFSFSTRRVVSDMMHKMTLDASIRNILRAATSRPTEDARI
jgi:hypothetical protein